MESMGKRLRTLTVQESPLVIAGAINALCALLAKQAGFKAIYLSGAGVANADFGLPDLGLTSLDNVVDAARKITARVDLPLLVDGDTGWGNTLNVKQTVQQLIALGAAGVHFEDQTFPKRCGHRDHKILASSAVMQDRIKAAVDARTDPNFVIMARTDAASVDGIDAAIGRAQDYVSVGADMIFAEAVNSLADYKKFTAALGKTPVLANITEFGLTPLLTQQELAQAGIKIVLYPLSALRAMNFAALQVYQTILQQGSQQACIKQMQTRDELYSLLDYYTYEKEIDNSREPNV
jgi:methylisocitrate lyase